MEGFLLSRCSLQPVAALPLRLLFLDQLETSPESDEKDPRQPQDEQQEVFTQDAPQGRSPEDRQIDRDMARTRDRRYRQM